MKTCVKCGVVIVPNKNMTTNFCGSCTSLKDIPVGVPHIRGTVYLKGYGNVSEARIKAIHSQVMLPEDPKDGKHDYLTGTKLDNGKIKDTPPDIYR